MSDSNVEASAPAAPATQPEAPAAAPAKDAPQAAQKKGAPKKEAGAKKEPKAKKGAAGGKVDVSKFPLPPYAEHRIKLWEEFKKQAESAVESKL